MKHKGLSQEGLKLIACVSMLIDHIGAVLVYQWYLTQSYASGGHRADVWNIYQTLRCIGRVAFPIYCYLLVEGVFRTRNMADYRWRMILGALLSEIPFNLAFSSSVTDPSSASVMVTLLLGLLMTEGMEKVNGAWKAVVILPFFLLAECLRTDYAGNGIAIIAMLALTRGHRFEKYLRLTGFTLLLWFGAEISLGPVRIPMELLGLVALIPISCYSGRKITHNKAVQWAFYLFYPVHLTLLWLLENILFG